MVESPGGYFARFDRFRQGAAGLLLVAAVAELAVPKKGREFTKPLLELRAISNQEPEAADPG